MVCSFCGSMRSQESWKHPSLVKSGRVYTLSALLPPHCWVLSPMQTDVQPVLVPSAVA